MRNPFERKPAEKLERGEQPKSSLKLFLEGLKNRLINLAENIFKVPPEEKELRELKGKIVKSKEVENLASRYFRNLIPRAIRRPEKEYTHKPQQTVIDEIREQLGNVERTATYNKSLIDKFKRSWETGEDEGIKLGIVVEEDLDNSKEVKLQQAFYQFDQEGEKNVIRELVLNFFSAKSNLASSELWIFNKNNSILLDSRSPNHRLQAVTEPKVLPVC